MALIAAHLNAEVILVVTPPYPLSPPPSSSLISLMVCVDIKQQAYLVTHESELSSCVKVEVAILDSPSVISLMVYVDSAVSTVALRNTETKNT